MLPLLVKDLTELAQRRRLFLLRGAVAAIGMIAVGVALRTPDWMKGVAESTLYVLGRGGAVLDAVVAASCFMILLALPAFAATAFTAEKERGSLPLLLLTRLPAWRLVLEKWLGLVAFALSLAVVLAPLAMVAFALGGLEPERLAMAGTVVLLSAGWAAAVGLACSAWCRTSGGAFLLAYLLLGGLAAVGADRPRPWGWMLPWAIYEKLDSPRGWTACAWSAAASLAALALAWWWLPRRLAPSGRPLVKRCFAWLDDRFAAAERRCFGRHVAADLPGDRPVAWRAARGRSLANPRYLVRLLLPVLLVSLVTGLLHPGWQVALLGVSCLFMAAIGASLVAGERDSETIEVLLVSGITPAGLLREKAVALRNLHLGLAVVLLPPVLMVGWVSLDCPPHRFRDWLFWPAAMAIVLLPLIAGWIGVLAGVLIPRRGRAIACAALALVGWWLVLPVVLAYAIDALGATNNQIEAMMALVSPFGFAFINAIGELDGSPFDQFLVPILGGWIAVCLLAAIALRFAALRLAERFLRRS